jgi:transcriptional regulator with XRE-family HTH domain
VVSLSSIDLGLKELFGDPERRNAFFRAITQDEIASQIRALRKERDLTQSEIAGLAEMKQSAISRIEQAEYAAWNLNTLFRVAEALNARWRVVLQPCEEAVKEFLPEKSKNIEPPLGNAARAALRRASEVGQPRPDCARPLGVGLQLPPTPGNSPERRLPL